MARQHSGFNTTAWLWIDQICIDHASTKERNHQVALMSRIYYYARQVLIWLGRAADDSSVAIHELIKGQKSYPWVTVWTPGSSRQIYVSWGVDDAIRYLLNRSYFGRLWTVQACVLARSTVVWCGDMSIPGAIFFAHRNGRWMGTVGVIEAEFPLVVEQDFNPMTLGGALHEYCELACSTPVDHVHGVQAIVQQDQRLQVDYTKSKEEVLLDVMNALTPLDDTGIATIARVASAMDVDMSTLTIETWARATLPQNEDNYNSMRETITEWNQTKWVIRDSRFS